jgi:hypothetical protein
MKSSQSTPIIRQTKQGENMRVETNSILEESLNPPAATSAEIKSEVSTLVKEDTPEALDRLLEIAIGNGISVSPNMSGKEIQERIRAVI